VNRIGRRAIMCMLLIAALASIVDRKGASTRNRHRSERSAPKALVGGERIELPTNGV
jgi:hypothetical protein